MHLHLTIPLYLTDPLHVDFTDQTLNSLTTKHSYNLSLIINHATPEFDSDIQRWQQRPNTSVIQNPQGNTLAAAWNLGIRHALNTSATYTLIINNDIIFHPAAIDNLVKFAQAHPKLLLWTGTEWSDLRTLNHAKWDGSFAPHPHFSCFMVNQNTINTIGWFDEKLEGAYFEDNDYHIRLLLSGHQAAATTTAKFYHFGSRTANIDDDLKNQIKKYYLKNRAYIQKKWGLDLHGHPGFSPPEKILQEIYPTPFNDPNKSLKDW